jgi:transcriptional regulator with XRE-family HTH domain
MTARTLMGEAAPGSRLARLHEAQPLVRQLISAGWTLARIGAGVGLSLDTVRDWKRGKRAPNKAQLSKLRALAAGFEVIDPVEDGFTMIFRR